MNGNAGCLDNTTRPKTIPSAKKLLNDAVERMRGSMKRLAALAASAPGTAGSIG